MAPNCTRCGMPLPDSLKETLNAPRIDAADGSTYPLKSFLDVYGGNFAKPPKQWLSAEVLSAKENLLIGTEEEINLSLDAMRETQRVILKNNGRLKQLLIRNSN
jgi:hypothetical protein